jgi:hypothetical protein
MEWCTLRSSSNSSLSISRTGGMHRQVGSGIFSTAGVRRFTSVSLGGRPRVVRGTGGNRTFTNSTNMQEKGGPVPGWTCRFPECCRPQASPSVQFSTYRGAGAEEVPSLGGQHVGFPIRPVLHIPGGGGGPVPGWTTCRFPECCWPQASPSVQLSPYRGQGQRRHPFPISIPRGGWGLKGEDHMPSSDPREDTKHPSPPLAPVFAKVEGWRGSYTGGVWNWIMSPIIMLTSPTASDALYMHVQHHCMPYRKSCIWCTVSVDYMLAEGGMDESISVLRVVEQWLGS